jgi:hypothetical protein
VHRLGERESWLATPYTELAAVLGGARVARSTALGVQSQQVIVAAVSGLPAV